MTLLLGFSDNPLHTHTDLVNAACALIKPLEPYKSQGGARIKVVPSTGAGFSETAAQLEGFARPLWFVAELLRMKSNHPPPGSQSALEDVHLESWIAGLKSGTDPQSDEYWGDLSSFDQRMVEMETIAFALLVNPAAFDFASDPGAQANLIRWLRQINEHEMPQNNWLWFRVLVNLALVQSLGVSFDEVRSHIDGALNVLDTFYICEGWSSDGLWGDVRKQVDYYSGSFAMQFAQCLFVRFANRLPGYKSRIEKYKEQAREFAAEYWRYFDVDGVAIPFGRSLTYRFAMAAFWGAVSFANIPLPSPVSSPGTIKGILLRHLRWWTRQPHIFNADGTQNIGYCYPNMYMAEGYNSPQSVYWSLKSFLVLGLEDNHPFWTSEELPHPLIAAEAVGVPRVKVIWPPRHILVNAEEHHFLLSSGQSTTKRFKAREAKYAKFAYSSAFGFSVPCGSFLEQIAPDSTLAVSLDNGEESWKVRWEPYNVESMSVRIFQSGTERIVAEAPSLTSKWRPWIRQDFFVQTTLIAPTKRWPGWHIRIHRVQPGWRQTGLPVKFIDGGFAISAQTGQQESIFELDMHSSFQQGKSEGIYRQGWWNDGKGSLVVSEAGASGVVDLTNAFMDYNHKRLRSQSIIIQADPNTNIISQRTLIPAVQHLYTSDNSLQDEPNILWMVTGVFAIQASAKNHLDRIWQLWGSRPEGRVLGDEIKLFAKES